MFLSAKNEKNIRLLSVIWNVLQLIIERESGQIAVPEVAASNGIKIAVIGSGPSGLVVCRRYGEKRL